jgi:hypothetical protein
MILLIFVLGALLGILVGGAIRIRYVRHELAADISPQLRHMQAQLDNLEAALNLAVMSRYAELSALNVTPVAAPAPRAHDNS